MGGIQKVRKRRKKFAEKKIITIFVFGKCGTFQKYNALSGVPISPGKVPLPGTYFFMYIKVDIQLAQKHIRNKDAFDAFCLAVLFKARYGNSLIYKHTAREMKSITHLGTDKIKRCIRNGFKLNLYSEERGRIRVRKVHFGNYRFIRIRKDSTFKEIVAALREGLILNRASQARFVKDIIDKASIPDRPLSKKEMKAYKECRSYVYGDKTGLGTMTKKSIAKMVSMSKSSADNIIRRMKSKRLITVRPCIVPLEGEYAGRVSLADLNLYEDAWYVTRCGHSLFRQLGNYYLPTFDVK